jgi:serine/threonine-protein kinase
LENSILGGRYELIEVIGEGGMGTVYKACDRLLDRIVAVKILKPEFQKNANFIEKFHTEALAAARISHPNIVSIYDVGEEESIHYIVMEYIEGQTLKEYFTGRKLPLDQAIGIAIMICDGVNYAHEKGVIHRDIKPQNILITKQGTVKVADFGIARANSDATVTFGQNMVGSVHYVAPEQAKGDVVDCTADIYSIGCVLYEMMTGQVPYDAESLVTVVLKHIHDEPEDPRVLNPAIPDELAEIILQAMEKEPVNRFPSAEALKCSLIQVANDQNLGFSPEHGSRPPIVITPVMQDEGNKGAHSPAPKRKFKIRPMALLGAALVLLAFAVGFLTSVGGALFGQEIVVPEVLGLSIPKANETLRAQGLEMNVIDSQYHDEADKDTVFSQEPAAGSRVKQNREVQVIISLGPQTVDVPDLRGDKLSTATFKLQNEGLTLGKTEEIYDSKYELGQIISQFPAAGVKVKPETEVTVMISKGAEPKRVTMPTLTGKTLEEAKTLLTEAGLTLGEVKTEDSTTASPGYVTSQNIAAGTMVDSADVTINLSVSSNASANTTKPATPEPPTQEPTTRSIRFSLPAAQAEYVTKIVIKDSQGSRDVHEATYPGGNEVIVSVSYYYPATCEIYLNGNLYRTESLAQ